MADSKFRNRLEIIIFGTDTRAGKNFDLVLIYTILISVLAVMLDSVENIHRDYGTLLLYLEWFFTLLFTIEYILRIYISKRPHRYIFSFYGIVDLLSVLPAYLALFVTSAKYLLIVRLLRVLRVFRVLKLIRYVDEANLLMRAIRQAGRKILVFFFFVLVLSVIFGSLMFLVEGREYGFTSIPRSIYWTIVTITTVGYGDITPQTVLGQLISTLAMLIGYSIIAIPTGILSAELIAEARRKHPAITCGQCRRGDHEEDAVYCKHCGAALTSEGPPPT